MKKYAMLVLAGTFLFNVATIAQNQTPPQGRKGEKKEFKHAEKMQLSPEKRAERMAVKLGLTDAEKAKVQALFVKQDIKRDQHQAEIKKLRDEHIAKFENERKSQDAELEKIIGKDKFQKLENERVERKAEMAERHDGNQKQRVGNRRHNKEYNRSEMPQFSAEKRASKMAKLLGLTDAERNKVQDLFEKQKAKIEQHQAVANKVREEQKAQFETERRTMNADLEKIIGSEKFQKLENTRSERKEDLKERREGKQFSHNERGWMDKGHKQMNGHAGSAEKRAVKLAKILDLNVSQKAEVQSLFEKQEATRHQQIEKIEKMREEMKSQFEAQRKTNDEALAKIIGPEKFQKYQSMRSERQDKMKDKSEQHRNHSPKSNGENN